MSRASVRARVLSDQRFIRVAHAARQALVRLTTPSAEVREWRRIDGDRTLRLDYDLDASSVVLDVGGYEGQWASDIVAMYGCRIDVFEPAPDYASRIERRFSANPLVTVHHSGLAGVEGDVTLNLSEDGSSHARTAGLASGETVEVHLTAVDTVFEDLADTGVDLMKVNIEGAEYDLLDHMVAHGLVEQVRDLQVQFHDFVPDADVRMQRVRDGLARTHRPTYQYDYLWDNWHRRD